MADKKFDIQELIEKGKACEIDAINGVVCEWGRKCGVKTPFNDKIVEIINTRMLETSPDFYYLNKLKVGEGNSEKLFDSSHKLYKLSHGFVNQNH